MFAAEAYRSFNKRMFRTPEEKAQRGSAVRLTPRDPHSGVTSMLGHEFTVRRRTSWRKVPGRSALSGIAKLRPCVTQWAAMLAVAHARGDVEFRKEVLPWDFARAFVDALKADKSAAGVDDETEALEKAVEAFKKNMASVIFHYARRVKNDFKCFRKHRRAVKRASKRLLNVE